ncbi:MAG: hypothetical protein PHT54_03130 [Candidatus Nanoarchaeia archaeon]|nr:hypothetical protein [Candidatus Nanoarchaeia archaeon]
MDIKKTCRLCSEKIGAFTCIKCGRLVCRNCYVSEKKLCKECIGLFL